MSPIATPYATLREYTVLFARTGNYVAVDILTPEALTPNQLAAFAPQAACHP
jgi:hypothetical protein